MVVATFVDIEVALSNARTRSIINALAMKGVPVVLCQWIEASLEERVITSSVGEVTLTAKAGSGCPQGGVLSPLHWSVLVDELIKRLISADFYCIIIILSLIHPLTSEFQPLKSTERLV